MKIHKPFRQYLILALLLGVSASASASAEVVVIVSARSAVTRVTADQAARIFLGKANIFPGGGGAVPLDQLEGSSIRDEFYTKVAKKGSSQLAAYWARIIFTGDGHPPEVHEGNGAMKKAVANNPNAIGYIDKSAVDSSVRVILTP